MYSKNTKDDGAMAVIGAFVIGLLAFIPLYGILAIENGIVLIQLWKWFVVHNASLASLHLAELNLQNAVGLGLIISFLTYQYVNNAREDGKSDAAKALTTIIFTPIIFLIVGFVVHSF